MKKVLLLIFLAAAGVLAWYLLVTRKKPEDETPKLNPLAVSKHSAAFNSNIDKILTSYYALSEAFVNWDSVAINMRAAALKHDVDSADFSDLKKDTVIFTTAESYKTTLADDLSVLTGASDLTTKRHSFNSLSQNMYDLLRTVKYDGGKVYLQQCPMAFENTEPNGLWISKEEHIRNPYLGKKHPKYKAGMLECGETKETLDNTATAKQ
jgi:hypothetical protein